MSCGRAGGGRVSAQSNAHAPRRRGSANGDRAAGGTCLGLALQHVGHAAGGLAGLLERRGWGARRARVSICPSTRTRRPSSSAGQSKQHIVRPAGALAVAERRERRAGSAGRLGQCHAACSAARRSHTAPRAPPPGVACRCQPWRPVPAAFAGPAAALGTHHVAGGRLCRSSRSVCEGAGLLGLLAARTAHQLGGSARFCDICRQIFFFAKARALATGVDFRWQQHGTALTQLQRVSDPSHTPVPRPELTPSCAGCGKHPADPPPGCPASAAGRTPSAR